MSAVLQTREALFEMLARWSEQGWLRELDRSLAQFFAGLDETASPLMLLATALASHR